MISRYQDPLALRILEGEFGAGETVLMDADLKIGEMTFERETAKALR